MSTVKLWDGYGFRHRALDTAPINGTTLLGRRGIVEAPDGQAAGADPRSLDPEAFNEIGHRKAPLLSVIRSKCLDCCCGNASEVRDCVIDACVLWPYRMGTNPFRAERSEAQKAAAAKQAERLRVSR